MNIEDYFGTLPAIPDLTLDPVAPVNASNMPAVGDVVLDANETYTTDSGRKAVQFILNGQQYDIEIYPLLYELMQYNVLSTRYSESEVPFRVVADNTTPPIGMVYPSRNTVIELDGETVRALIPADGSLVDPVLYPTLASIMEYTPYNTSPYTSYPDMIVADRQIGGNA